MLYLDKLKVGDEIRNTNFGNTSKVIGIYDDFIVVHGRNSVSTLEKDFPIMAGGFSRYEKMKKTEKFYIDIFMTAPSHRNEDKVFSSGGSSLAAQEEWKKFYIQQGHKHIERIERNIEVE